MCPIERTLHRVIKMDKKDLYELLRSKENEFEKAKGKRAIKTIAALSVVIFAIMYFRERPRSITEIVGMFFGALFLAGIDFWFHAIIFTQLCGVSESENRMLEDIKKRISKME